MRDRDKGWVMDNYEAGWCGRWIFAGRGPKVPLVKIVFRRRNLNDVRLKNKGFAGGTRFMVS